MIIIQILSLVGLWLQVDAKAVTDQQAEESQASSITIAQQRVGYDYSAPLNVPVVDPNEAAPVVAAVDAHDHHHDDHHHHHEDHDPGFWKKKVEWKEGWKKYWVYFIYLCSTTGF